MSVLSSTVDLDGMAEGCVMPSTPELCRCGHPPDMHDHDRSGSDCGACGRSECPAYRPPNGWRRYLRRLHAAETQNELLWAEVQRLRESERALRNSIALHPYSNGRSPC